MTSRPWIYVLGQVLGQVLGLEAEAKAHGSQKKLFGVAHVQVFLYYKVTHTAIKYEFFKPVDIF